MIKNLEWINLKATVESMNEAELDMMLCWIYAMRTNRELREQLKILESGRGKEID